MVIDNKVEKPMETFKKRVFNQKLDELERRDFVAYISAFYIAYEIKMELVDGEKLTPIQLNSRYKYIRRKSDSVINAYNHLQTISDNAMYLQEAYGEIKDIPNDDFRVYMIGMLYNYFLVNGFFNQNIEDIENFFIEGRDIKRVLIYSPMAKELFFENNTIESVRYNFFDDSVNTLMSILFTLRGIEAKKVNIVEPVITGTFSIDYASIFPPYRNSNLISRITAAESDVMSQSFEWNITNRLITTLSDDGIALCFFTTGALNKVSDEKKRRQLIDKKYIDTVIELPRLQLFPNPIALVSIKKNSEDIKMINATKFAQNLRRGVNLDSDKIVRALNSQIEGAMFTASKSLLLENNYDLTPKRYSDEMSSDFHNPTPLSEITKQIYRGYQIPSEMLDEYACDEETRIKLLTLSSIDDGEVIRSEIQSLKGIDKKMEHYLLESGDLVISCKGKTFKTAVIEIPYGQQYISTGSLIVIRCDKEKLDPMYLKIFLDSDLGKAALKRIQTGTTVLSLNPSKLLNILVPLPHLSKQIIISSSYKYKKQNLKEVKDVLKDMEEEIDKKFNKNFLNQIQ